MDDTAQIIKEIAQSGCSRHHLVDMLAVYLSMSTRADFHWSQSFLKWALEAEAERLKTARPE